MTIKKYISMTLALSLSPALYTQAFCTGKNTVYAEENTWGTTYLDDTLCPADNLTLPYTQEGYKITGNITLPETIEGYSDVTVAWESDKPDVINTHKRVFSDAEKAEYGERYEEIPAGIVTRQAEDTTVTLTATIYENEEETQKSFDVTVKAKPEKNAQELYDDNDFGGYLYTYFSEPPLSTYGQQAYFAYSRDGLNWTDLNDHEPVFTSNMGTGGIRDHYITRSPEGDKFYFIATDLDITAEGLTWDDFAYRGSKYIMVWESDDLVNWSDQRMVKIADDDTGCVWAPEVTYDEVTGEYIMYWSGRVLDETNPDYDLFAIYYVKTRDFYSFTPQEKFVYPQDGDGTDAGTTKCFLDTTMIKGSDNNYYRVTKYEWGSPYATVFLDTAKYPLGDYDRVSTNLMNSEFQGVEGPALYRFNKSDAEQTGYKFGLMLDGYQGSNRVGFFPTVTEDLSNAEEISFTRLTSGYTMPTGAKHGAIISVTDEEYAALQKAYGEEELELPTDGSNLIVSGDFENIEFTDIDWLFENCGIWYSSGELAVNGNDIHASVTDGGIGQNVKVEKGAAYRLTAKIKSTGNVSLCIQNGNAEYPGSDYNTLASVPVESGDEWQTVTLDYVNTSHSKLFVYVWSGNGETTCLDDVKLTKIPQLSITATEDSVSYTVTDAPEYGDIYTALYDENGYLIGILKDNLEGDFDITDNREYMLTTFFWDDTMKPICGCIEKKIE